jgi:circadian clock protein KaiB
MEPKAKKKAAGAASKKAKAGTTPDWGEPPEERYVLRLYVTGMTPNSVRAIENMKAICEEYLLGRYDLEIIDVYKHPSLAKGEQIVAAPTLVKSLPMPLRRLIGDLSQKDRVLLGLDLAPKK